ncbi:Hypp5843 [Branchiostoma lanceolatum]|uniref:Hypp5843 protein n=1 Tax=Branchiostoma lanceolatum TaxID=7740 RepID=A0A8J9YR50_BRALA|nr:Hypp5843 [Branchiostoma lanceolatum]
MASLGSALRLVATRGLAASRSLVGSQGRLLHTTRRKLAGDAAASKRQAVADSAHIDSIRDKVNATLTPGMDAYHYAFYAVFISSVVVFLAAASQLEPAPTGGHGHGEEEEEEE